MHPLFAFFTALAVSVAIIPLMMRLAPHLGLVDRPDLRKIHATTIPRVGGVGIVVGALIPVALWASPDPALAAYLFGAAVLLAFGLWDDARQLGPYTKFLGQFLAVVPIVLYGDVFVAQLPLVGAVPEWIGKPFAVLVLVGMINALNTSDGLDGLAGGLAMLSLAAVAYLMYDAGAQTVLIVAVAGLGGIFGFLRYNTHPARVFMGDGGSQFLGFTLGVLVVLLLQRVNPVLSPALPALLLGLPVADLLVVMVRRLRRGASCFRPDKNHVHHRLLDAGFDHYEAVIVIYSVHALFVLAAVLLRYESDVLILALYLGVCMLLFGSLDAADRFGWRWRHQPAVSGVTAFVTAARRHTLLTTMPTRLVAYGLPFLLVAAGALAADVPRDLGIGAAALAALLLVHLLFGNGGSIVPRAVAYIASAFVVYLETRHGRADLPWLEAAEIGYFAALALAIALAARFGAVREFAPTPMDFLVVAVVLGLGVLSRGQSLPEGVAVMAVEIVILFYGAELILSRAPARWNPLNVGALTALGLIGARGIW